MDFFLSVAFSSFFLCTVTRIIISNREISGGKLHYTEHKIKGSKHLLRLFPLQSNVLGNLESTWNSKIPPRKMENLEFNMELKIKTLHLEM